MVYPDSVLKYKRKCTLVRKKGDDLYYLHRVYSHRNRNKEKRGTDHPYEYLGSISHDAIIEPKAKRVIKSFDQVIVMEYGATFLIQHLSTELINALRENFQKWKEIFVFAVMRLMYASPMKNVEFLYRTPYLS